MLPSHPFMDYQGSGIASAVGVRVCLASNPQI